MFSLTYIYIYSQLEGFESLVCYSTAQLLVLVMLRCRIRLCEFDNDPTIWICWEMEDKIDGAKSVRHIPILRKVGAGGKFPLKLRTQRSIKWTA